MDNYPWCFDELMKIEGGYVDNVADRGGKTSFGITQATLSTYANRAVTDEEVRDLKRDDAFKIYFVLFWEPLKLEQIKDKRLAYAIFDQAVNRGQRLAIKNLQEALNKNLGITDLQEDGIFGTRTITILNDQAPEKVGMWYCERCMEAYSRIVEYNSSQSQFLRGWLARVQKLQRLFWDAQP